MRCLHDPIPQLRELRGDVPELLNEIGLRALARTPGARYPSAQDVRRDLETFIAQTGMSASARELAEYVCQLAEDGAHLPARGAADDPDADNTFDHEQDTRLDS
jgi:hypothetical protein